MIRSVPFSLLLIGLGLLCGAQRAAAQAGGVAPISSHSVETRRRTLRGLPIKRVITSAKGWKRVTSDLEGAPPAPDFSAGQVSLLVVADVSGGARTWVESLTRVGAEKLRVSLARVDGKLELNPHVRAFFFTLPKFSGGVELVHRTLLEGGGGAIQRKFPPEESDRSPARLPQLGPDIRFSYTVPVGTPFDGDLKLRYEAFYRNNRRIPARQETVEFPAQGLPYPRIRKGTGVMHVYAAHTKRLRCRNALAIDSLPPTGKDGQPRVIRHRFELQPIPGAAQPPEKQ